jgi:phosphotransferase system  glucose/maltose/N-acetylglucosamine-specific IIC component
MSAKWKIFFALNFILAIPAFVALLFLIINFSTSYRTGEGNLFFALAVFGLLMITGNGFLNIYVIQRFFPDKLLPVNIKRLNTISLVINFILITGLLILCIYGATIEFRQSNAGRDTSGKIALVIFCLACLIHIITLILQVQILPLINRNNSEKINSLINSIGNSA